MKASAHVTCHSPAPRPVYRFEMETKRTVAALAGALTAALGVWAMVAPRSFYEVVATYPPYNEHLLHDVGAFQLGLGAVLLLGAWLSDGLTVALAGGGAGTAAHAWAHFVDLGEGGNPWDPWALSAPAIALLAAAVLRWREVRAR